MSSLYESVSKAERVFDEAQACFNAGRLQDANRLFRDAHVLRPDARSLFGIGLVAGALKRLEESRQAYLSALDLDWRFWQARVNLGVKFREAGALEAALHQHGLALVLSSAAPQATYNLGETLQALGERDLARHLLEQCAAAAPSFKLAATALKRYRKDRPWPAPVKDAGFEAERTRAAGLAGEAALEALGVLLVGHPDDPVLLTNYGNALFAAGHGADAAQAHKRAVAADPRLAVAHHNLGYVHHKEGRLAGAARCYRLALACQPRELATWLNLGHALRDGGKALEALDAFRMAADIDPGRDTGLEVAKVARQLNLFDVALETYRRLEKLNPEDDFLANEIGACLFGQNKLDEARPCFERAARLDPASPWGHANLAGLALTLNDYGSIRKHLTEALKRAPDNLPMAVSLAHASQQVSELDDLNALSARVGNLIRSQGFREKQELSVLPFPLFSLPLEGVSLADHLACARRYGEDNYGKLRQLQPPPRKVKTGNRRVRVGYLSCDFHGHPVAQVIAETIELHDRSKFEVFALAHGKSPEDEVRKRLRAAFEHFADLEPFADQDAARMIRERGIDILVDLGGYTKGARGGLLAMRSAPIQINYVGYPGTLGVDYVDYLIADPVVIPPELEGGYSEKVLRMPHCYLPSDRKRPLPPAPTRASEGLPDRGVVFCAYNSPYKITPDLFEVWCRLLREFDGSVLWLRSDNPSVKANLIALAGQFGVPADRLVFAKRVDTAAHYARLRLADIFLDTFPYGSHSTGSDALWAGVPVVTQIGEIFASRVAASLLTASGLPELIASSRAEYFELARSLASDPPRLRRFKAHLETERLKLPVFELGAAHTGP